MKKKGFTLIELLIVITIIAILAAVGISIFLRAKITANEAAAISELKTITSAQEQFVVSKIVDVNNNGIGEYGLLGELSGLDIPRNGGSRQVPPFISSSLSPNTNITAAVSGRATTKSGYIYQILLPGIQTDGNGTGNPDNQEIRFRIYAWPANINGTGKRVFFADVTKDIVSAPNDVTNYEGVNNGPAANSAIATGGSFPVDDVNFNGKLVPGEVTNDGQVWLSISN